MCETIDSFDAEPPITKSAHSYLANVQSQPQHLDEATSAYGNVFLLYLLLEDAHIVSKAPDRYFYIIY